MVQTEARHRERIAPRCDRWRSPDRRCHAPEATAHRDWRRCARTRSPRPAVDNPRGPARPTSLRAHDRTHHPAPRPDPAGDPDADMGHQLAVVSDCSTRGIRVDVSRGGGDRRRHRLADGGEGTRTIAEDPAPVLARNRRRHAGVPGGVERRHHLRRDPDSVRPRGGARLHHAAMVGAHFLGRARRTADAATDARHRAGGAWRYCC